MLLSTGPSIKNFKPWAGGVAQVVKMPILQA
jgi:hypothetical protein